MDLPIHFRRRLLDSRGQAPETLARLAWLKRHARIPAVFSAVSALFPAETAWLKEEHFLRQDIRWETWFLGQRRSVHREPQRCPKTA
jgi:hypothetical protein